MSMNIGQAAEAAGVSAKMIRHYEAIGLLPAPARTDAGYRQYDEREISVLHFIRQARQLGFSTEQIAELMGLWSNSRRASRTVRALAQRHVDELERRMREMAQMKDALEQLIAACHGDDDPHCAIIEQLAVHSPQTPGQAAAPTLNKGTRHRATKSPPPAVPQAHPDLMAWTHQVHRRAGR